LGELANGPIEQQRTSDIGCPNDATFRRESIAIAGKF
jgi:hypothetical protein